MTSLPERLEHDLKRLPIGVGLPWVDDHPSEHHEQIPLFVVRLPEGVNFARLHFRIRALQDYAYPEGMLLEVSFEVVPNRDLVLPFSLLLAPGLPIHQPCCRALVNATTIEIGIYAPDLWCIGWRRMVWPELYRQTLKTLLGERPAQKGSWNVLVERWERNFAQQGRKPLPHSLSTPLAVAAPSTQQARTPPRVKQPSSPLPASVREQLQSTRPLEQVVWHREPLRCYVKVPANLSFEQVTLELQTPSLLSYAPEGPLVVLPFMIPTRRKDPTIRGQCLWNPVDPVDRALLSTLAKAKKIELVGCAESTTALVPLGCKELSWNGQKRQAVHILLAQTTSAQTRWPEAKERFLREQLQHAQHGQVEKAEQQEWHLPSSWKQQMRGTESRTLVVRHKGNTLLPRVLLRVPEGTQVENLSLTASAFNVYSYEGSMLVCLHLLLRDATRGWMPMDVLFDPVTDRKKLKMLTLPGSMELLAVADTKHLSILGAMQWTWSASLQERARHIWTVVRQVKHSGRWNLLVQEHYRLCPQVAIFQTEEPRSYKNLPLVVPSPPPPHQKPTATPPSVKEPSPSRASPKPVAAVSKPATSASLSETHKKLLRNIQDLPLVERCILRQRLLAREEYQKSYPPSQLAFWRMLLPLALEQSRKFIWRPEAVALTEEQRQHLDEGKVSVRMPRFPDVHLWFEFATPIETCVAADTAAIFLFAADDPELMKRFARQTALSAYALNFVQRTYYRPARHFLALNVINHDGEIVWAMKLPEGSRREKHVEAEMSLSTPDWFGCASVSCQFHREPIWSPTAQERRLPCAACMRAYDFFSTWMVSAWKGLLGVHRTPGNVLEQLGSIGEMHHETTTSIRPGIDEASLRRTLALEHQYRIVRHIDIAAPPKIHSKQTETHRGSWIDALTAIDPALVDFDEREVPERTRTLHDPRFAKYIAEHGTNQVKVRPHHRTVPMRSDPKRITEVTAETSKPEQEQDEATGDNGTEK
ncbi:hypothetical protein KSF_108550 [Reticulibacter mediterranei]|uniref:Uncharacterized protein n=1 Tax=Reticulibacter mediterranei TaxID=2778369 RepID=A0A8J3N6W2_9CHLR|nr:hypothetical protein [Reticulibacter mediterranei]GHP00808.1 hypothetical protein KSF_108550 [Reticulibacter mediterranei]